VVAPPAPRVVESEAELKSVVIKVETIDREKWKIQGVDKSETTWTFAFGSATKIRTLWPEERTVPLSELLLEDPDDFPIEKGQKIVVHWKPNPERRVRIAERFTLIETE
jgi:hypothetical protein